MPIDYHRLEAMVPLYKDLVAAGIHYGTHGRMDEAADQRRMKAMSESGCNYIGFGAESAHPETLRALNKGGQTLSHGLETIKVAGRLWEVPRAMTMAMRNCIEYGIHANLTWIAGCLDEDLERLKHSVAFMLWQIGLYEQNHIPASAVNLGMFSLQYYPGTPMEKKSEVQHELTRVFNLTFDPITGKPICNDALEYYCLGLDDATNVMFGPDGEPLNFSKMPNDQFLQVRELIDSGRTLDILSL